MAHALLYIVVPLLSRYAVRNNLTLDSVEDAISELKLYKAAGGSTVCDVTSVGIRLANFRPEDLQHISRETGVNIVMGTGFYVDSFLTEDIKRMSVQEVMIEISQHIYFTLFKDIAFTHHRLTSCRLYDRHHPSGSYSLHPK